MTRKQALAELIAKVEAGALSGDPKDHDLARIAAGDDGDWLDIASAYTGSLDAAEALHEAVLPRWAAIVNTNGTAYLVGPAPYWERHTGCKENSPARAWLLAILRALHASEPE